MRRRYFTIALLCFSAVVVGAITVMTASSPNPVDAWVVSVSKAPDAQSKTVALEFRRLVPAARFTEDLRVQTRSGGVWQQPERFPMSTDHYLFARTNSQRVVFTVPEGADAFRFSLAYRVGTRPYCKAYFFLHKRGIYQKVPKLSRLVLKLVPQQARLRHAELDVTIPLETNDEKKNGPGQSGDLHSKVEHRFDAPIVATARSEFVLESNRY